MPEALGDQQAPRPQEVFISYSRKDKEFVRRLYEALKRRNRDAWVDWEDVRPTEDFMQAIFGAIEGADTFISVLTPDSIASIPCGRETAHAAANNKRMVPIVAREVDAKTVPEALAKLDWISFYQDSDDFEKRTDTLVSALDTDLNWVHAHTRLLTRAIEWNANGKNNSFVLRGDDLRAAEQWLAQAAPDKKRQPTALQTEYIVASRKAGARRQRITLGAVTFALVVAIALAIVAFFAEAKAKEQTKKASEAASRASVSLARYSKEGEKNAQALAYLGQALRLNPENREASGLTTAMLTQLSWHVPLTGPMRNNAVLTSAQFSSDGQRVMTGSMDERAQLWDVASGKPIGEPMQHQGSVYPAQFSPDGQRVVTVSGNTAQLWDAVSGKLLRENMQHKSRFDSAQFSPNGQWVMTTSDDNTARLWDAASGKSIGEPMQHQGRVNSAQFSTDGQRVVTASEDNTARLWDAASGKPIGEPMQHESSVSSAQFSPNGRQVVTASGGVAIFPSWDKRKKMVQLWDALSGKPIGEPMKHEGSVYSVQFSPDGQRLVTASAHGARLWDAVSDKPLGEPMQPEGSVYGAQFSPDGQRVVTVARNSAWVWDAISGKPLGGPMQYEAVVMSAQFSPDGEMVVTASADGTVLLWDAASGKPLGEPMKHGVYAFSPDGRRVVTAENDKTARLRNAGSGEPVGDPMKHESIVESAEFSPDGQRLVTTSNNTVRLWEAATGKPLGKPMKHEGSLYPAQFSPDGQRLVTASTNAVRLWDAVSGKPLGEPMQPGPGGSVDSAQFSADSQRVLTLIGNTAQLWDAVSGRPLGEPIKHEDVLNSTQFSPDGQRVVTASGDNTARLWDAVVSTDKDTTEDIFLLAELAEAAGGVALETVGQAEIFNVLTPEQREAPREKIASKFSKPSSKMTSLQRFLKWSVADRRSRTISPLSQEAISEWLDKRIKDGTVEGLRAALQVDPANPRVTAHLGRRLADEALKQGSDPDEARRARGEADFLTRRAQKLAPDSVEVRKLRDEVVELLKLKTD